MEQLLIFLLGSFSVLILLAVGIIFKIRKEIEDYRDENGEIQLGIENEMWDSIDLLERRIDQEIDRTDNGQDQLHKEIDKIYELIDKISEED
ncbi:hypothetical protein OAE73_00555 [bacterium]|nr:hypothetical protein [bacterium]